MDNRLVEGADGFVTENKLKAQESHPIQSLNFSRFGAPEISRDVTERAYQVYAKVYGPQPAILDLKGRGCRGGFSIAELVAFLYAASFPENEWRDRVKLAFDSMRNF